MSPEERKEHDRIRCAKYRSENREKRREQVSRSYYKHREKNLLKTAAWHAKYPWRRKAFQPRTKLNTPSWVDKEEIYALYQYAHEHGLEVDHIQPIKGFRSCGLHVIYNLQLLTRDENTRKSYTTDREF